MKIRDRPVRIYPNNDCDNEDRFQKTKHRKVPRQVFAVEQRGIELTLGHTRKNHVGHICGQDRKCGYESAQQRRKDYARPPVRPLLKSKMVGERHGYGNKQRDPSHRGRHDECKGSARHGHARNNPCIAPVQVACKPLGDAFSQPGGSDCHPQYESAENQPYGGRLKPGKNDAGRRHIQERGRQEEHQCREVFGNHGCRQQADGDHDQPRGLAHDRIKPGIGPQNKKGTENHGGEGDETGDVVPEFNRHFDSRKDFSGRPARLVSFHVQRLHDRCLGRPGVRLASIDFSPEE